MQRREVLKSSFSLAALALCGGAFAWSEAKGVQKSLLRPPGALAESKFEKNCIRCGLCVEACPFDTLKLATFTDKGVANGTPFFEPRSTPCFACEKIFCAVACPTKALDTEALTTNGKLDIFKAKMGIAVVDSEFCLAYNGLRCDACYRACPKIDKALRVEVKHNDRTGKHAMIVPVVDGNYCIGCGKCEKACITKKATITVIPRAQVVGEIGDHYVRGWVEEDEKKLDLKNAPKFKNDKLIDKLNEGVEL